MRKVLFTLVVLLVALGLISACANSGSASGQGGTSTSGTGSSGSTIGTGATNVTPATGGGGAINLTPATGTGVGEATPATSGSGEASSASATAGNPKAGEALFNSATIGSNPGCKTCHTIDGSKLVGPSLQGVATRAGTRVPGQSAEQYIRTSILDPNAFVVPGFSAGIMPSFKGVVTDAQLNDLVAYLLTLK